MKTFYADNAATTAIDPAVVAAMKPFLSQWYGNASMSYQLANRSKVAIEEARDLISHIIRGENGDLFFTSGGTEANNWALKGLVDANSIDYVITSPLEHKSVLAPLQHMHGQGKIKLIVLPIDKKGEIDMHGLGVLLKKYKNVLVSLMHGNNEIGNINNIKQIALLCDQYGALFHTDMVQTIPYYPINLTDIPVSACTVSAHKFHGPKGVGFLYINNKVSVAPLFYGGNQEKNMRPGTENIALIVGMSKALSLAHKHQHEHYQKILRMKKAFIKALKKAAPNLRFHGLCQNEQKSLPNIVNIGIPTSAYQDTVLLHLDILGIQASAGSACTSGTHLRSHVLEALQIPAEHTPVRFSFSKNNRLENIPIMAKKIATLIDRYTIT